jgi:glutaminyl-peptide cyclotransferase
MTLGHVPNVPIMSPPRSLLTVLLALAAVFVVASGCGDADTTDTAPAPDDSTGAFDENHAYADLERMVALGPRPSGSKANAEQARMLADELRDAGVENVAIGKPPLLNVTGEIPGRSEGSIVVAAHHDTKDIPGFVGANDGASGVAVVLQLARSLPKPLPGPSVAIALFDGEEARGDREFDADGTRGSRRYVEQAAAGGDPRAGIPPLDEIEAMVLFDMIGDCDLQIPREFSSDERLYDAFARAAGGAPFEGVVGSISDDHVPFLEQGIPSLDLIDFTYGGKDAPGEYWHTTADTTDKVCPQSLDVVGEAAMKAIPTLP